MSDTTSPHPAPEPRGERWETYDASRNPTGRTMPAGVDFRPGEYHLVIHVCIFDMTGGRAERGGTVGEAGPRMLIQRRAGDKVEWPGMWDVSVGGSIQAGETSQMGAQREVFEELGLRIDFSGLRPLFTLNFGEGFDDFYLVEAGADEISGWDGRSLDALAVPNREVTEVRWATRDDINVMVAAGEFVPWRRTVVDFIFDMIGEVDAFDLPGRDYAKRPYRQ